MGMETNGQPHATVKPTMYPRVIVVGNLTIDDVVLPDGTTRMSSVGGNSLYTLLGARLWQSQVGVVTRRGEDFPRDLTEMLNSLVVATDGIVDIPGPTVRNWVVYESSGERPGSTALHGSGHARWLCRQVICLSSGWQESLQQW